MKPCTIPSIAAIAVLSALAATAIAPLAAQQNADGPGGHGWRDFWQPGWMHRHMWGAPDASPEILARMRRHRTYMHDGIPSAYRNARSSVKRNQENIAAGGKLYAVNCASCHGTEGLGDGDAAKGLSPSPALLNHMIEHPVAADEYLLWTISEGGKVFDTDMPAFKDTLSKDEIWKIVTYMRAGFPKVAKAD